METPHSITELKAQVRNYSATNPDMVTSLRICADVEEQNPDLFGWVRLWLEVQYLKGVRINPLDLFGTLNQDGED